jgi:gliding motility-associated-like protein
MKKLFTFFASLTLLFPVTLKAQLTATNSYSGYQLVQKLVGTGVSFSNVTYTGDTVAKGFFYHPASGTPSNLGLDSGIILSSGNVTGCGGNSNIFVNSSNGEPGDGDINTISGKISLDASVLEFDFVPLGDTLRFNYVFSSEEYTEWVNTGYNDAFGFFLSGPGITGPFTSPSGFPGGAVNVALVPGTTSPVSIDNVNCLFSTPYYVCNEPNSACLSSYTCPASFAVTTVAYDGFTAILTAEHPVQSCQTYHIKLAIADCSTFGGDNIYDSGVFIEAGSFAVVPPNVSASTAAGDTLSGGMIQVIEGCGPVKVEFCPPFNPTLPPANDTIRFSLGGQAVYNVDYTLDPDNDSMIVVYAGQQCAELFIYSTPEGMFEPDEFIQMILHNSECTTQFDDTFYIKVVNVQPMDLIPSNDTGVCRGAYLDLGVTASGGYGSYYYAWNYLLGTDSLEHIRVDSTSTFIIMVGDSCGNAVGDTVLVNVYDFPEISLTLDGAGCLDSTGTITFHGDIYENSEYHWDFGDAIVLEGGGRGPYTLVWETPGVKTITSYATFGGCSSDTVEYVFDLETCPVIDFISNIFTPNGDGTNDFFHILNLERFPGSELSVYNRWGKKVYENLDYANNWDGKNVSEGVYYYILKIAATKTTEAETREGFVTITR